ncbi:ABC transporter permease [Nocardioides panzhihuensis]|uniref:Peptide/nickel transport system permease protein n=1 Tax=Nocardioides panzhihuensis TaxID=860243 RepID=A0A7Z0DM29_9ACTN|nr:ABC transporter permease [Nocardioides panzhihuensis]NYI78134.1 peptide/nickel transport system permease protein [Nocardioides panzhihuensis]
MLLYAGRRLTYGLLVLALVATLVFLIIRLIPGDVVRLQLADAPGVTQAQIDQRTAELGLDEPVLIQFGHFVGGLLQGDLGTSFDDGRPVTTKILERLPATLELGLLAILFGVLFGVPFGLISAIRHHSFIDNVMRFLAVIGMSLPNFWLALLLITFLALWFGWSPPLVYASPTEDLSQNLIHMLLPAIALGAATMASIARMLRSSLLEVLGSNFIRTIRSRGASERVVVLKHAGRSSMIPVFTVLGLQVGSILGGTVILERIFAIPGMGSLIFEAVGQRDYPVILGCVIFYGAIFIFVNVVVDLLYAVIDPRIRYEGASA